MAGTTNNLVEYSKSISNRLVKGELDVLLTSGEQVTSALMAGALSDLGVKVMVELNRTEGEHTNARIIHMNVKEINDYISSGGIAVVPGSRVSKSGDIASIGRGGSDATAVAIAKIFETDSCEIYTDVDGVYSSDPNKIPLAKKL